jgi:hypothetical protein
MPRYNAHFIPVKHYGHCHPVTGKMLPLDVDYQVRCFVVMVLPLCQRSAETVTGCARG